MTTTPDSPSQGNPIVDGYNANAEYWIDIVRTGVDRYQQELTDPALRAAIGSCAGQVVLDAGCGEGTFTRSLLESGAAQVHGVDSCLPLIDAARNATSGGGGESSERLRFWHADVDDLPLPDSSVDVVVANRIPHALDNPEVRFLEFARVLRPRGRLVLLSQHPCFYTHRDNHGHTIPHAVTEYFGRRVIRQHFSVAGMSSPAPSVQPLYSLEAYVTMIVGAGFAVTGLQEPHPTPQQLRDPWWAANFTRPLFLIINATRRT